MKLNVIVKTNTSQEKVAVQCGVVTVWIRQKPVEGQANAAVIKALAGYFGVAKSRVVIKAGLKSKRKVIVINE